MTDRNIESVQFGNQTGENINKTFGGTEGQRVAGQERKRSSAGLGGDVSIPDASMPDPPKRATQGSFANRFVNNLSYRIDFEEQMPHDYY